MSQKKKYYCVRRGHKTGIFPTWAACQEATRHFSGAEFKGFVLKADADAYMSKPASSRPMGFGSAKKRKGEQTDKLQTYTDDLLADFADTSIRAYTDGSAVPNPGFGGAGLYMQIPRVLMSEEKTTLFTKPDKKKTSKNKEYVKPSDGKKTSMNKEYVHIKRFQGLGSHVTNNIAELTAIEMALEAAIEWDQKGTKALQSADLEVLTDSSYAIGCLTNDDWKPKINKELIAKIRSMIKDMRVKRKVRISWVGGHADLPGNEEADRLASKGKEQSKQEETT